MIAATAIAIALGADQRFTTVLPGYTQTLQEKIERSSAARREIEKSERHRRGLGCDTWTAVPARRSFAASTLWLNTPGGKALSLAGLRGRVVLVDFWTYSCINCLRTLPHLKAWDRAYRKAGLTIVGVHSPEFAFERVPDNVRSAVQRLGVRYPVALDNDFATWRAYSNQYWPAKYLIDRTGRIRYDHYGEGDYDETEARDPSHCSARDGERPPDVRRRRSARARIHDTRVVSRLRSASTASRTAAAPDVESEYRFPEHPAGDQPRVRRTLDGRGERIVAGANARLRLRFQANDIFLVLAGRGRVRAIVDGASRRTCASRATPRLYTIARFDEYEARAARAPLLARRRGLRVHVRLEGIRRERPGRGRVPEAEREAQRAEHRDERRRCGRDRPRREREPEADGHDRHRDGGEEREQEERGDGDGLRRDRREEKDTDAGASAHAVDEPDPERAGRSANRVPVIALGMRMRVKVEVAVPPADEQPQREKDDERGDGRLGAVLESLREVALGEEDRDPEERRA